MACGEQKDTKVCPHCGYCEECGRGGHQMAPVYPVPTWPSPWWQVVPWPYHLQPYTINWGTGTASDNVLRISNNAGTSASWSGTLKISGD